MSSCGATPPDDGHWTHPNIPKIEARRIQHRTWTPPWSSDAMRRSTHEHMMPLFCFFEEAKVNKPIPGLPHALKN